jgi:serine/threonine protein kinase
MPFVGEGTYGCVYKKPPLKCKNKTTNFGPNQVSKLMHQDDANAEISDYKVLRQVDPTNIYYPGPPNACDVNEKQSGISENDCSLLEDNPNLSDYKLLFYKDGGIDLDDFVEEHLDDYLKTNRQKQTDQFFLNAHSLFMGIQLYINKNFIHHDIKPSNIVFDQTTYAFKFIDFGLSVVKSKLVNNILKKQDYESFHWSYPMEVGFTNSNKSYFYNNLTDDKIKTIEQDLIRLFVQSDKIKKSKEYKIKPSRYTHTTFRYMIDYANTNTPETIESTIKSTMDGLRAYKHSKVSFEKFVNDTVPFIDIYAFGFTMNHMLNSFYRKDAITNAQYLLYSELFKSMFHFDFTKRIMNIDVIINNYEEVLRQTGVLGRLNLTFVDHKIVKINKNKSKSNVIRNNKTKKNVV